MLGRMAILAQQDPDDPANSYVFWAIAALIVLFVLVVVLAKLL
jgi:hypothetical protein